MPDPAQPRRLTAVATALTLLMVTLASLAPMTSVAAEEPPPLVVPDLPRGDSPPRTLETTVLVPEIPAREQALEEPSEAPSEETAEETTKKTTEKAREAGSESAVVRPAPPPPAGDATGHTDGEDAIGAAPAPQDSSDSPEADATSDLVDEGPRVVLTPPEPLEPPPLTSLEIMLDWYPGPQHAALLIAQHKGMLERRGLQVTLTTPADPSLPTRLLAAGRVDLAVSRQPLLHLQVDRGLPLVRVGTLVELPLAGLLLLDDGVMESPAQLAGRRIGYSVEESRELLLPLLLRPHGIVIEELELVDVNFSAVHEMVDQGLDGVMTPQRLGLAQRLGDVGISTRLLQLEEHGIPHHEGLILVANRDRVAGQRESLRRLLEALAEATAWSLERPEAAWALLAEREPAMDTPANRAAWMPMLLRLSARPAAMDRAGYARFEALLHERGLIETLTPPGRLGIDLGAP
ncbi:ABC transporter substrate-binding protein [Halomonas sp. A11-A]|uniref:ABC transporter substrate-binding protein n=1 Tax=Halomonas sp. A11-A TaxID=2183985 RepID=UPI000D70EA06|nr:ABC transporter substrate-binding protein [Halomonas sp. A11-A]PWV80614.1 putative hydroxymethylpyrimidine transport system substrate-binding protein [Halomonas sp. A11-A]